MEQEVKEDLGVEGRCWASCPLGPPNPPRIDPIQVHKSDSGPDTAFLNHAGPGTITTNSYV